MNPKFIKRGLASLGEAVSRNSQFNVFDRSAKLLHRSRANVLHPELSRKRDYLRDEVALKTIERLAFITRSLDRVLDFGSNLGHFLKNLCIESYKRSGLDTKQTDMIDQLNKDKAYILNKLKSLVMVDSSHATLFRDINESYWSCFKGEVSRLTIDEEVFSHPILEKPNYFDAVISNMSLHWINDLPTTFLNINRVLKPDGLFMGTLVGGDTLHELRTSLQLAELERKGGMSPRVSPLVHLNDVGTLLNRAGFNMLTIDTEDIIVGGFPDIVSICEDLQIMGEQNALIHRSNYLPRDVILAANEIYKSLHGEVDENGNVTLPVTYNIIFMIGWKKCDSQPKPSKRGLGNISLKDVL